MDILRRVLNWQVKLYELRGIPVYLHISILFLVLVILRGWQGHLGLALEVIVLLVLSVLLHEYGHALVAQSMNLKRLSIVLHGFGGFATHDTTEKPRQRLWIAAAGPLVTFFLAGLFFVLGKTETLPPTQIYVCATMASINLVMGIANLVPTLPFDGGNILNALLWQRYGEMRAIRTTGQVGFAASIIVFLYCSAKHMEFLAFMGFMGGLTSLQIMLQTRGFQVNWAESRRRVKSDREQRKRDEARSEEFLTRVKERELSRRDEERFNKLLGLDDPKDR